VAATWIGAGGWGYFSGGLASYARAFDFVEVNATFYRHASDATARRWRAAVPARFAFSVKVHHEVSHRAGLRPTPSARSAFARSARTAALLRAPFLILETPASVPLGTQELEGLRELAEMVPDGCRLGLECRAYGSGPLPPEARSVLEDLAVLDVTDLTRVEPRLEQDAVYARIFGKGEHNLYELDDEELRSIDRVREEGKAVAYAFHGVRMYKDAARFLAFRRTGSFPPATNSVGLASLAEVLAPDVRFPADRNALLRDHGWKVIDLAPDRREHAAVLLSRLPDGRFASLQALLDGVHGSEAAGAP
jgi:uncharacterized protein YecE (DUF72 family)